mgnify:CR=1 FL=1
MDKEFKEGAERFKRDIKSGKIKVTPDLFGRFAQIFAPTPVLKLKKDVKGNPQDPPIKKNKRPRIKNQFYKFNLFQ